MTLLERALCDDMTRVLSNARLDGYKFVVKPAGKSAQIMLVPDDDGGIVSVVSTLEVVSANYPYDDV